MSWITVFWLFNHPRLTNWNFNFTSHSDYSISVKNILTRSVTFHPFFTFNYWQQNTVFEYSVNLIIRNLSIIYRWLWFANDSDWSMTHSLSSSDWSILTQFRRGWLMKQFLRNQLICCNKRLIKDKTVTGPFLEYKPSFRLSFQPFSSFLGVGFYHFGQLWLGLIDRKLEHIIYHSHENHDFAFQWIFMASEIMKIEIL